MKILAIETSCDETAIAILDASGDTSGASFEILGNSLLSQIDLHQQYGGVFPALAKREHAKNLVPLLKQTLSQAGLSLPGATPFLPEITTLLEREPELALALTSFVSKTAIPDIDVIAVTHGPGLEPALWVGVNLARALSLLWNKPLIGVNHMEGHMISALADINDTSITIPSTSFPLLALLISGGHTQLVAMNEWLSYTLVGETRDDAVGEAFDKVARMMDLPYPGGPEISKLAERARLRIPEFRTSDVRNSGIKFPRPMLHDPHCDFSFSGLKTAVLYHLKKHGPLSETDRENIAREFEDAVSEVLWKKTARALMETGAQTLALGGGVSANIHIQQVFTQKIAEEFPHIPLHIPSPALATDNALMIALAGYFHAQNKNYADPKTLSANGNLKLA